MQFERAFLPGRNRSIESGVRRNHDHNCFRIELQEFFERAQSPMPGMDTSSSTES